MGNIIKVYDKINNLVFHGSAYDGKMEEYRLIYYEDDLETVIYICPRFLNTENVRFKHQAYYAVWQKLKKENRYIDLRVSKHMIEYKEEDLDINSTYKKEQTINLDSGNVYTSLTLYEKNEKIPPAEKKRVTLENNRGEKNLKYKLKQGIIEELLTKIKNNGK
jgi:hypothetical protein